MEILFDCSGQKNKPTRKNYWISLDCSRTILKHSLMERTTKWQRRFLLLDQSLMILAFFGYFDLKERWYISTRLSSCLETKKKVLEFFLLHLENQVLSCSVCSLFYDYVILLGCGYSIGYCRCYISSHLC